MLDASKSKVNKLSGNKQLSSAVKLVVSWIYSSSLVPEEYASVFFISTMFCLNCALPLKGSLIRHFSRQGPTSHMNMIPHYQASSVRIMNVNILIHSMYRPSQGLSILH